MDQKCTRLLSDILKQMANTDQVQLSDIPNIDLYMDQVTHFMEDHLQGSRRYEDDKILTKTMINNYAKNKLLPPPEKKRYSREHMIVLIFIYYLKGFLPLSDIKAILEPVTERFFNADQDFNLQNIYEEIYNIEKEQIDGTIRSVMDSYHKASHSFTDVPEDNREFLQFFCFICLLSLDIYLKKEVIEKMIDSMNTPPSDHK